MSQAHILLQDELDITTRLRGFEVDQDLYPNLSPEAWVALSRELKEGKGIRKVFEDHNAISNSGMTTLTQILKGDQAAWQDGRWYQQALGCGPTAASSVDTDLYGFMFRKSFTDFIRTGRTLTASTFFSATDFASTQTTVLNAPAPNATTFTVAAIGTIQAGDLVRVGLATGYEYKTVLNVVGAAITLTSALSAAPILGTTVDQVIDECGVFGDKPATYTTGTVTFTNGSPTVTGVGTFWTANVGNGDKIRLAGSRKWYTILTVNSDTSITLTSNYAETTAAGASYSLRGTLFSRGSNLRYVKSSTKGFVFETQWIMGS